MYEIELTQLLRKILNNHKSLHKKGLFCNIKKINLTTFIATFF